jgi:hypothetical protein
MNDQASAYRVTLGRPLRTSPSRFLADELCKVIGRTSLDCALADPSDISE